MCCCFLACLFSRAGGETNASHRMSKHSASESVLPGILSAAHGDSPVVPAPEQLRQENHHQLEAS